MPNDVSAEQTSRWELLTQTGTATPMGELLRRYWWPIGGASQFEKPGVKPVRLLGEDLVLYKDLGGRYGLLDRHCRHRRADMSYGYVEACGLRCNYHGWLYDETGRCLAQPYEDIAHPEARLKDASRTGCGRSDASACGRLLCSSADTSSTASRSTTRTRSASPGISRMFRKNASRTSRRRSRPGRGRSATRSPAVGSPAMS